MARYADRRARLLLRSATKGPRRLQRLAEAAQPSVGLTRAFRNTSELNVSGGDDYVRKERLAAGTVSNGVPPVIRAIVAELGKRVFDHEVDYGV